MQKRAETDIAMPPGRFTKEARETWRAWVDGEAAQAWNEPDWLAARRLIRLVDDSARCKDAAERRRLAAPIRTGSRDLGLHEHRAQRPKFDPYEATRVANRAARAAARPASTAPHALVDPYPDLFDDN